MILEFKLSFSFLGSLWKSWSLTTTQTWVKDAIGVPSYDDEVKGHIIFMWVTMILEFKLVFHFSWSPLKSYTTKINHWKNHWNQRVTLKKKSDDLRPIFIDLALSFKILGSTLTHSSTNIFGLNLFNFISNWSKMQYEFLQILMISKVT